MTELANLHQLNEVLTEFISKLENKDALLRHIGLYSVKYVRQTMEMGGRPSDPWQELSPFTIALRRNKDKKRIKPLIDTGVLRNSIHILGIHDDYVDVGTAVDYASKLHFGGMTEQKEFNFRVKRHKRKGSTVRAHNRRVVLSPRRIPARPYMYVGNDGERHINKIISDYVEKAMNP